MPVVTRRQSKLKAISELKDNESGAEKHQNVCLNKKRRSTESKLDVLTPRSLNANMNNLPGTKAINATGKPVSHALAEKASVMSLNDEDEVAKPMLFVRETAPSSLLKSGIVKNPVANKNAKLPEENLLKPLPERPIECNKLPDGPEPVIVDVEYPETEDLLAVEGNVESHLDKCINDLAAADWMTVCSGLLIFRRLIRYNTSVCAPKLGAAVPHVVKAVRSLRSALAKTAIMTVRDLYLAAPSEMLHYTDVGGPSKPNDSILAQVLLKAASNDKKFVIEEAERSLSTMSDMLPPTNLIQLVSQYTGHKNPKVRGKAAKVLAACVDKLNDSSLHDYGLGSLIKVVASLINDNSPDARDAAKAVTVSLKRAFYCSELSGAQLIEKPKETTKEGDNDEEEQVQRSPWEVWCISELGHTQAAGILRFTS
jgi:hypothetical protein